MKTNLLVTYLFLYLALFNARFVLLHAQTTNNDCRFFEETKAQAEKGDVTAEYLLFVYYQSGKCVPKDEAEAKRWLNRVVPITVKDQNKTLFAGLKLEAEKGDIIAEIALSWAYENGTGVEKNPTEAIKWLKKAADSGFADAQEMVGSDYYTGNDGVIIDYGEALKWYHRAADQGFSEAQIDIGIAYRDGRGVAKDYVEAYKWFYLASLQGNEKARNELNNLQRDFMAYDEVTKAQNLVRSLKTGNKSDSNNSISPANPTATGTGFFITEDGYLITNDHVVKDATKVRLVTSAGTIDATVVKVDVANDLALLKAAGRFAPLPVATSRGVKLGGTVATIGFPNIGMQGFSPKLAKGEIASLSGATDDARYFQISVPVQPGNSGGALVDERGNVIGIVSAKLNAVAALKSSGSLPENVNYAVKSSFLLSFLESVPEVSAKLKEPISTERKFEDVVKSAQSAAVLVLVY
jgi:TPR repeat protein